MDYLANMVVKSLEKAGFVQIEVSARHVHLCQSDVEKLFGEGHTLTFKRPLSQPGQFLCEERVAIKGEKGGKANVAVLGPARSKTQIELSVSDCVAYGVKPVLRESGDVEGSAGITITGSSGEITLDEGAIVALSHIHVTPEQAALLGLHDKQKVCVEAITDRPLVFKDVIVRVRDDFSYKMHVDFDEANAAHISGFTLGRIMTRVQAE